MSQHKRPSQKDRVLALLQEAGGQGVRTNEFLAEHLPRFGARIYELRNEGWQINGTPDPRSESGVVYVLVGRDSDWPLKPRAAKRRVTLSSFLTREQQWALLNACDEVIGLAPPGSMPRAALIEARKIVREEIGTTAIPMDERDEAAERYSQ